MYSFILGYIGSLRYHPRGQHGIGSLFNEEVKGRPSPPILFVNVHAIHPVGTRDLV